MNKYLALKEVILDDKEISVGGVFYSNKTFYPDVAVVIDNNAYREEKGEKKIKVPDTKPNQLIVPKFPVIEKLKKGEKIADIIIPHHNRHDLLKITLEHIPNDIFNIIIVSGGTFAINNNKAAKIATTDRLIFCFKGDTLIETESGGKNIKDVLAGDVVKTHLGRYRKVLNIMKRKLKQGDLLLWIKTANSTIKVTPEHPFYILRNGNFEWKRANELYLTDRLLYPANNNKLDYLNFNCYGNTSDKNGCGRKNSKKNKRYYGRYLVDVDLARFLGLYLAEGCGGRDNIRFTFNEKEIEYQNFIRRVCREKFDRKVTVYNTGKNSTQVNLNIRSFNKIFLKWFGKNSTTKKIPSFVFDWNLQNKLAFIKGYCEGDGSKQMGGMTVNSASKELIDMFELLCKSVGLDTGCKLSFKRKESKYKGIFISGGITNMLRIKKKSWEKLLDIFNASVYQNYYLIPIIDILKKKTGSFKHNYVYNLEVEEDNSYIANSVIAHNCNDDVIINDYALQELVSRDEDIVGVPLRIMSMNKIVYGMNMYWGKYGASKVLEGFDSVKTALDFEDYPRISATGAFFLIKKKVFEDLGGFKECYRNGGEDNHLFLEALEKGYTIGHINTICDHYHSSSSGRYDFDIENHKILTKNFPFKRLAKILGEDVNCEKVSIIIPVRKGAKITCLDSIKKQSYKNIETIIIRDKDKKGASWARNEGFKKSKGKYVFFCDHDIELHPNIIEAMLKHIRGSGASFTYCNYDRAGEFNERHFSKDWDLKELKKFNYISTMSLILAKDFPGFDEKLERFQDWDLWLTMAEDGKFGKLLNHTLFTAYYSKGDISTNKENFNKCVEIIKKKHNL